MSPPLVVAARRYIGAPFRHRGRGPHYYDCAGLLLRSFKAIGAPMQDLKHYGREPFRDGLREIVRLNLGLPIPREQMAPGDVVLMHWHTHPHHLALIGDYVHGGLSLIHTHDSVGRVEEVRLDATLAKQITEVYRWHG